MDKKVDVNVTTSSFGRLLTVAFIVLKVIGVIDWPWIWVLCPIWIGLGIVILLLIILAVVTYIKNKL